MKTGESVRIYYVIGGPNLVSSFYAIGGVWNEVFPQGSLALELHRYIQTTPVLPGSVVAVMAQFSVLGDYKLVDHALSRVARKGALAVLHAEGSVNDKLFDSED